jgi:hypothetical protein
MTEPKRSMMGIPDEYIRHVKTVFRTCPYLFVGLGFRV